ncbi:uncharacterized protein ColSpa_04575 [Colletotrichum spaethianum]|uniref:Uncharacterized protein n=1 Tax=Colletotrichum spaethianum TaxID=700344 RepID=A0AA37LBQ4_9PEZI|nr:uncharacterized protein ColSpa_04575 [Colletotrichum spaethianum]GKT44394.1 hypothetical protein ColSpa_04575 [Colletotrichum spaethianum]
MPPASWARWPSLDRGQRTGAASLADNVTTKDFATLSASKDSDQHIRITNKNSEATEAEIKQPPQSLSKRLGRAMKNSLVKAMPSKSGTKNIAQLEFPELEVLPTKEGYKDLEALQKSIATLKASERAKLATNPALAMAELEDQSKQSLAKKIPAQFQEAEHARHEPTGKAAMENTDGANEANEARAHGIGGPSIRPVTPANVVNLPEGDSTAATTTENWATPASRLSHSLALDDCNAAAAYNADTDSADAQGPAEKEPRIV